MEIIAAIIVVEIIVVEIIAVEISVVEVIVVEIIVVEIIGEIATTGYHRYPRQWAILGTQGYFY